MTSLPDVTPAKIFLEEWIATKEGLDQKGLAALMGTTPGTVTKKLQKPGNIDLEWMERFRLALQLPSAVDLLRHPSLPSKTDLALNDVLSNWAELSPEEKASVQNTVRIFASRHRAA